MADQTQLHADDGDVGGMPAPSARAQQAAAGLGGKDVQKQHTDDGVPAASARAQQAAAGLGGKDVQKQQHTDDGVPAASARDQQATDAGKEHEQQLPASSLNPTAARLLRKAIVSEPDGGKPAAESSDILAFARAVDRADSTLE